MRGGSRASIVLLERSRLAAVLHLALAIGLCLVAARLGGLAMITYT